MRLDQTFDPYLTGEKFSAGLAIAVREDAAAGCERVAFLEQSARGKRILHVGCLDHIDLIAPRIADGRWLHKRLTDAAEVCLGVDIDAPAAAEAARHGYDNVVLCNLLEDPPQPDILAGRWDLMILGEVLEHIDNPVAFLRAIADKYGAVVEDVLITVPNAFHLDNVMRGFRHVEQINTDHRFWFTPYTLSRVVTASGLDIKDMRLCYHKPNIPARRLVYRAITRRFPMFRGGLILRAGLRAGAGAGPGTAG